MLEAIHLSKSYSSGKALDDVSIQMLPGQICGLLGRNGAGKTTLFRILCGLIKPDSGKMVMASQRNKPVGGIIERPGLYPYLNAYDNIKLFAGIQGAPANKEAIHQSLLKVGLPVDRKDPVRNFSLGMKQRLGIAIALLNNPEYLVLDEPFSGLDPIGVTALINLITDLAVKENISILLSSHLMGELTRCCNYLYVMDKGRLVNKGTTAQLIGHHIHNFNITAQNITSSIVLQKYSPTIGVNGASIVCNADEIPALLNQLLAEGILVTSCTPELSLEQLVNTPLL
ncbi:ABC transporter ATP-binding protein [Mucilaginibacter aquatilis]|uniref:ATP-binding cassette domain-containing protein n=1 Tax=Mucilaginibacter aquatilis TaxID=1517760 RepID=A0A6I4IA74_9SPHI|nr:ABC transporter ATP-binding protein [Mucilaginibacter aquatilis]MVN92120.1 ATP-binding cassette domain-containing protein [Mucilaginibacter aquatilis]